MRPVPRLWSHATVQVTRREHRLVRLYRHEVVIVRGVGLRPGQGGVVRKRRGRSRMEVPLEGGSGVGGRVPQQVRRRRGRVEAGEEEEEEEEEGGVHC